jgi:hypothetical protein
VIVAIRSLRVEELAERFAVKIEQRAKISWKDGDRIIPKRPF